MHLRRLWFRQDPKHEEWKVYGFNCVQFGDKPAAALMTIAIERAAETYEEVAKDINLPIQEVKDDSKKLLEDTYVDDGTTGGNKKEVQRLIGNKLPDGSYSGTIPSMMKKVGLKLKTIVTSQSTDQEANITVLLPHVKAILSSWFLRWNNIVIPQLFKISKWTSDHPDLKEGDLCLLHLKKGKCGIQGYKYCRVSKIVPSLRDNKVRTVEVKYYNAPSKKAKYTTVDVRKLSLIPNLK